MPQFLKYKTENDLIEGLKNGEKEALSQMYSENYGRIINSLKFKYPSVSEIDTFYTDACIALFQTASTKNVIKIYNLLYTIAVYKINDFLDKKREIVMDFTSSNEKKNDDDDMEVDNYFIDELGEDLWSSEDRETLIFGIENSLNEISEQCKKILMLKYMEGLSYEEIGEELEINPETTRKTTTPRCREDLKAVLVKKYNF